MKRLYLVLAVILVAVVILVVALLAFVLADGPEDALEDIVESTNDGDARGVVDNTVFSFLPPEMYESLVNSTQDSISEATLSNLTIIETRYFAELNETDRIRVVDYVELFVRDYSVVEFQVDDYCIVSFSLTITEVDSTLSWTSEFEWLFVEVDGDWYVVGSGQGGSWG